MGITENSRARSFPNRGYLSVRPAVVGNAGVTFRISHDDDNSEGGAKKSRNFSTEGAKDNIWRGLVDIGDSPTIGFRNLT